eukprot:4717437-Lingulodinium_polyedra.AAC.1
MYAGEFYAFSNISCKRELCQNKTAIPANWYCNILSHAQRVAARMRDNANRAHHARQNMACA